MGRWLTGNGSPSVASPHGLCRFREALLRWDTCTFKKILTTCAVEHGLEQTHGVSGCQASEEARRMYQGKADEGPNKGGTARTEWETMEAQVFRSLCEGRTALGGCLAGVRGLGRSWGRAGAWWLLSGLG